MKKIFLIKVLMTKLMIFKCKEEVMVKMLDITWKEKFLASRKEY